MKFVFESLRCSHFTQSAKSACILCAVYGAHFLRYIVGQNVVVMPSNHTSNWKFQSHQVLPAISENANTVSKKSVLSVAAAELQCILSTHAENHKRPEPSSNISNGHETIARRTRSGRALSTKSLYL